MILNKKLDQVKAIIIEKTVQLYICISLVCGLDQLLLLKQEGRRYIITSPPQQIFMASMDNSDITGRRQKRDHEDSSTHSNKRQCTIREGIDTQQSATKDSSCTPQKTTNNGLSSSAKRNREIRTKRKHTCVSTS